MDLIGKTAFPQAAQATATGSELWVAVGDGAVAGGRR